MYRSPSNPRCSRFRGFGWILALAVALVELGLWALPAVAQDDSSSVGSSTDRSRVRLRVDMTDEDARGDGMAGDSRRRRVADVVRFGEDIHIRAGEHIIGEVVSIGGDIVIDGKVTGECVSVGGRIELGPDAEVTGDVVSVGGGVRASDNVSIGGDVVSVWGHLNIAETADIDGNLSEVGGPIGIAIPHGFMGDSRGFGYDLWNLLTRLIWVAILVGLGVLAFQIFPSRARNLAHTVGERGLASFMAGLAGWILWLPALVLLLVSVLGIPVALLQIFLTPVVAIIGYVSVAYIVGQKTAGRMFRTQDAGLGLTFLAGILVLEGTLLLGRVLGLFGSVFDFLGLVFSLIGYSVILIAATMGFGAFLITRFRPEPHPVMAEGPQDPGATMPRLGS